MIFFSFYRKLGHISVITSNLMHPNYYFLIVYIQRRRDHVSLRIGVLDIEVPVQWTIIFLASSVRFMIQMKSIPFGVIIQGSVLRSKIMATWSRIPIPYLIGYDA